MRKSKGILCLALLATILWLLPAWDQCRAEQFPNRPITIIIHYAGGGQIDVMARLMAKVAEKSLGVPLIIENKPGGGGTIGVTALSRAKPDGYTIGSLNSAAVSILPTLQQVPYKPFQDFDYICGYAYLILGVYARTDSPFKSIKDVIEAARKNPGKISYGAASPAAAINLKYVEAKENVKMTFIPMQSGQEVAMALVGRHTQLGVGTPDAIMQFVDNKEVRYLAVASAERWPSFPTIPTMKELGYDIDTTNWVAFGAPRGVPKERLAMIYHAFQKAHQDPEVKATLEKLWFYAPYISGEEVKAIFEKQATDWKPLIEGMKPKAQPK